MDMAIHDVVLYSVCMSSLEILKSKRLKFFSYFLLLSMTLI